MTDLQLFKLLDSIGTVGLAFLVWALMSGRLITRREYDREVARGDRMETKLDKSLEYGIRAIGAGEKLVEQKNSNG